MRALIGSRDDVASLTRLHRTHVPGDIPVVAISFTSYISICLFISNVLISRTFFLLFFDDKIFSDFETNWPF